VPIRLHLSLLIGGQVLGCFLLPLAALVSHKKLQAMGLNFVVVAFVAFILGYFVPRLILRYAILASCPKCGAPASFRGGRPITYHCTACGHVHRTGVFEGSGRYR